MADTIVPFLTPLPLVAVLRGITPPEVPAVADVLIGAGFRMLEVPLNSPDPFDSIRVLAARGGDDVLTGAGTVIDAADVARVKSAGGRLIVMPHADVDVIREAKRNAMVCIPGVATPTEAFASIAAGADALKLFPAEALGPAALKAWRAVLPHATLVFAVGGIKPDADSMTAWRAAGANGFGTGSNLYQPGASPQALRAAASAYAEAWRASKPPRSAASGSASS
jgi:2-dehydro-3-deoxyphosphogalactonate aldolase